MKHLSRFFVTGALLLSSISALGYGLDKAHNDTVKPFEIGEANVKGQEVARINRAVESNLSDIAVGLPVAQKVNEADGKTTIRFAAPVKVASLTKEGETISMVKGGDFGFNVKYNFNGKLIEENVQATNFFMSIETPSRSYYANELSSYYSKETKNGSMNDFYKEAFGTDADKKYNAFITCEVRKIPSSYLDTFTAAPYYVKDAADPVFSTNAKKADITGSEYAEARVGDVTTPFKSSVRTANDKSKSIRFCVDLWSSVMENNEIKILEQDLPLDSYNTVGNHYVEVNTSGQSKSLNDLSLYFTNKELDGKEVKFLPDLDAMSKKYPKGYTFTAGQAYYIGNLKWSRDNGDLKYYTFDIAWMPEIYVKERSLDLNCEANQKLEIIDSLGNPIQTFDQTRKGQYKFRYSNKKLECTEPELVDTYKLLIDGVEYQTELQPEVEGSTSYCVKAVSVKAGQRLSFTLNGKEYKTEGKSEYENNITQELYIKNPGTVDIYVETNGDKKLVWVSGKVNDVKHYINVGDKQYAMEQKPNTNEYFIKRLYLEAGEEISFIQDWKPYNKDWAAPKDDANLNADMTVKNPGYVDVYIDYNHGDSKKVWVTPNYKSHIEIKNNPKWITNENAEIYAWLVGSGKGLPDKFVECNYVEENGSFTVSFDLNIEEEYKNVILVRLRPNDNNPNWNNKWNETYSIEIDYPNGCVIGNIDWSKK